jgi:excisionase family DNA binding protein
MSDELIHNPEPLLAIKQASGKLGVHYWMLLRLVNEGKIPSYTFGNSRKRVYLSEVRAFIQASQQGGVR